MALSGRRSAPTWLLNPAKPGLRRCALPVACTQISPPLVMPNLQELVRVERIGLVLSVASAAAATCLRRRFKQQRRHKPNKVTMAQQVSHTLPGRNCLWAHQADAVQKEHHGKIFREQRRRAQQEEWREFLQQLHDMVAQTPTCRVKHFELLSRYHSELTADNELLRLIANQCSSNEYFLNQIATFISKRNCPVEQLHRELECAESRNAALLARLKKAEERKWRLDRTAQVLIREHRELLREQAELETAAFHVRIGEHDVLEAEVVEWRQRRRQEEAED